MAPSAESPRVAVVVATHGRATLLAELLDALDAQDLDPQRWELVVVDDDSPDATSELLAARGIRSIRVSRGGPGAARQVGWQATAAPVVAFTDDDCVPTPGWLRALIAPIERGDADFAQGRTLPRPDQADRMGPWARTQRIEREDGLYQTCNIAYRREVLEDLGGFRPAFAGAHTAGEDTDLAWRAKKAGHRSTFVADALVHHVVWASEYRAFLRDRRRWGMVVQVVKHHPQLRELAYARIFYRRSHVRAFAVAAAAIAAGFVRPWLPLALAAGLAAVYLARTRQRPEPISQRLAHLARVLIADVVEVAVFVRASIRYRTLLL